MNEPFELVITERRTELVVLVESYPFLLIRKATLWERLRYRFSRQRKLNIQANIEADRIIKNAAKLH